MAHPNPQNILRKARRIVIKIGTETIIKDGDVHREWLSSFAEGISSLKKLGKEVFVVSSGAIGLGRGKLRIDPNIPTSKLPMPVRQQAAMCGQISLMQAFSEALERQGLLAGQVLLTANVTEHEEQVRNLRNACLSLMNPALSPKVVPVVNENDTIATEEIAYGDNDQLGATLTNILNADTYVILSDVDGLYNDNPKQNKSALHIPRVESSNRISLYANDDLNGMSKGGMASKLRAFDLATGPRYSFCTGQYNRGATGILTLGKENIGCLQDLVSDTPNGRCTIFLPQRVPNRY